VSEEGNGPRRPRRIDWSDRAQEDLRRIGDYIAADDRVAAEEWVERLIADVERAAEFPLAGRVVPEAGRQDVRELFRRTYRIVYLVDEDAIDVLTIFEGHRRFPEGVIRSGLG